MLRWDLLMESKFLSLFIRLWLLSRLSALIGKSRVGLYRDNGITVINNANRQKLERVRKDITVFFKKERLLIINKTNLIETDFLDITFNLATNKCFSFWKTNNTPFYINAFSNRMSTTMKQLPKMINKRISDLSCNKEVFDKVELVYEKALKDNWHFSSMSHNNSNTKNTRRNRNRKVLWFNTPYSQKNNKYW